MVRVKDTSDFPWLCSTTNALKDDKDNIVCDNEEGTVDMLTDGAFGLYGIRCSYYKVSENLTRDKLYGEDPLRIIERSWYFMGYVQSLPPNVRTYQLQGIWGEDVVTMYASVGAFKYYSTYGGNDKNTPELNEEVEPRISDIIYIEANDTFYRIVDVKYWTEAFGLAKHTYTLTLKVYKDDKWTINTSDPTLSDRNDPIYQVANDSLSSCYQIEDPLKVNPIVCEEAKDHPDPYNNINVMYEEDARAKFELNRFASEISAAGAMLSAEFAKINTESLITDDEAKKYIKTANDYRDENTEHISDINSELNVVWPQINSISADGKVLRDIAGEEETVYYTSANN